jgi:hypothetical protein
MPATQPLFAQRWPILQQCPDAVAWLQVQANLGLSPRTLEAYTRGLADLWGGKTSRVDGRAMLRTMIKRLRLTLGVVRVVVRPRQNLVVENLLLATSWRS